MCFFFKARIPVQSRCFWCSPVRFSAQSPSSIVLLSLPSHLFFFCIYFMRSVCVLVSIISMLERVVCPGHTSSINAIHSFPRIVSFYFLLSRTIKPHDKSKALYVGRKTYECREKSFKQKMYTSIRLLSGVTYRRCNKFCIILRLKWNKKTTSFGVERTRSDWGRTFNLFTDWLCLRTILKWWDMWNNFRGRLKKSLAAEDRTPISSARQRKLVEPHPRFVRLARGGGGNSSSWWASVCVSMTWDLASSYFLSFSFFFLRRKRIFLVGFFPLTCCNSFGHRPITRRPLFVLLLLLSHQIEMTAILQLCDVIVTGRWPRVDTK